MGSGHTAPAPAAPPGTGRQEGAQRGCPKWCCPKETPQALPTPAAAPLGASAPHTGLGGGSTQPGPCTSAQPQERARVPGGALLFAGDPAGDVPRDLPAPAGHRRGCHLLIDVPVAKAVTRICRGCHGSRNEKREKKKGKKKKKKEKSKH